jgi:multicomponent Na+:H+ antiporter subunit A
VFEFYPYFNAAFIFSLFIWFGAFGLYGWARSRCTGLRIKFEKTFVADRLFASGYNVLLQGAVFVEKAIQPRTLRPMLWLSVLSFLGLTFWAGAKIPWPARGPEIAVYEWSVFAMMVAGILGTVLFRSRLAAVLSLGFVGYLLALVFVSIGAPDLAFTQLLVETLVLILFVAVIRRLPATIERSTSRSLSMDVGLSIAVGAAIFGFLVAAISSPKNFRLADFFLAEAWPSAYGKNVVNVILVDFRALDTLGEITVLVIAALGVSILGWALRKRPVA